MRNCDLADSNITIALGISSLLLFRRLSSDKLRLYSHKIALMLNVTFGKCFLEHKLYNYSCRKKFVYEIVSYLFCKVRRIQITHLDLFEFIITSHSGAERFKGISAPSNYNKSRNFAVVHKIKKSLLINLQDLRLRTGKKGLKSRDRI